MSNLTKLSEEKLRQYIRSACEPEILRPCYEELLRRQTRLAGLVPGLVEALEEYNDPENEHILAEAHRAMEEKK